MRPADAHPVTSWWTTTDRDEFAARRQAEQERMARSTFGRMSLAAYLTTGGRYVNRKLDSKTDGTDSID